jgi:hypothetical protein
VEILSFVRWSSVALSKGHRALVGVGVGVVEVAGYRCHLVGEEFSSAEL